MNDGRFCIDNNLVENAVRPLAWGRKNFMFCENHDAAVRAAIVYSLVNSCKAMGVDSREWMENVILRIPGSENSRETLRELLPDRWVKQTNLNQLGPTWANGHLESNNQVVFYRGLTYEEWIKFNEELLIWENNTSKACWPVILGRTLCVAL